MGIQTKGNMDFFLNFDEKTLPLIKLILDSQITAFCFRVCLEQKTQKVRV